MDRRRTALLASPSVALNSLSKAVVSFGRWLTADVRCTLLHDQFREIRDQEGGESYRVRCTCCGSDWRTVCRI